MRFYSFSLVLAFFLTSGISSSQMQSANMIPVEDFKPAVTNQPGKEFPKVNSEGRVRAAISAPGATKVQLDISAVKYDLVFLCGNV